jgi:hypothetical protein
MKTNTQPGTALIPISGIDIGSTIITGFFKFILLIY